MSEASPDARTYAVSDEQHALPAVPMSSAGQDISAPSPLGAVLWRTLTEHMGLVNLMSPQEYGGAGFSFVETFIVSSTADTGLVRSS
jgi:hypothetical protein